MKRYVLGILLFVTVVQAYGQLAAPAYKKPKNSAGRGTMYAYFGLNQSGYSKSDIKFFGLGYDFTLNGSKATDDPSFGNGVPQLNAKLGYYIRNNFSVSLGLDHMKYVFADNNDVLISGTISPGLDTVNNWNGSYTNVGITTNRNTFHYENNGLNYLKLGFERTDNLYEVGHWLMFSSQLGVAAGGLLTYNDFRFAGQEDLGTVSFSGMAASAHVGLRMEFFKYFFIQANANGGYMKQIHVSTRHSEPNDYARHGYGYYMFDYGLGFLFYIRPTNACDSCPVW